LALSKYFQADDLQEGQVVIKEPLDFSTLVYEFEKLNSCGNFHFLFTPNDNGGLINGNEADLPTLCSFFRPVCTADMSLVFAFSGQTTMNAFIKDAIENGLSEQVLIAHSIRRIHGSMTEKRLAGGSFSSVTLSLANQTQWRVIKTIYGAQSQNIDAGTRLIDEAKFIAGLPPSASMAFPHIESGGIILEPDRVGYVMNYCPYPTLAESFIEGYASPKELIDHYCNIYEFMLTNVYSHPEAPEKQDDNYFERIDRRFKQVMDTEPNRGAWLKKILEARIVHIDGREYDGFLPAYERLKKDSFARYLAIPPDHCLSHGDMIMEDILLHPHSGKFKLIDPNSKSCSKYYDLAKTLLSLSTKYELLYFDRFHIDKNIKDDCDVKITFNDHDLLAAMDFMEEKFWNYLEENSRPLFGDDPHWRERLILLNSLQNAAIVMFHFIHHDKEERAVAFLLMAIKKLSLFFDRINHEKL